LFHAESTFEQENWDKSRDMGSIIPTFYDEFLYEQIPKEQKGQWKLDYLSELLGSAHVKAFCKHVGEIDTWWTKPFWNRFCNNK
jgi:hypothetical protein